MGKDWDKMYLTLPFNPPRTPGTRSHDLEGRYLYCAKEIFVWGAPLILRCPNVYSMLTAVDI